MTGAVQRGVDVSQQANPVNIHLPLSWDSHTLIQTSFSISFIFFAGTPSTTQLSGTSLVSTAPAAMTTLLPIVTPGRMVTFPPIHTSSPMVTDLPNPKCLRRPLGVIGWLTVVIKTVQPHGCTAITSLILLPDDLSSDLLPYSSTLMISLLL